MIEPYTDHVMNPEEITRVRQELDLQESEFESEDVVVQEQWDENVFEYQGYHLKQWVFFLKVWKERTGKPDEGKYRITFDCLRARR